MIVEHSRHPISLLSLWETSWIKRMSGRWIMLKGLNGLGRMVSVIYYPFIFFSMSRADIMAFLAETVISRWVIIRH